MGKKCMICNDQAAYLIKDSNDYYCSECAVDNFGDVSYLMKVEEQARILKQLIEERKQQEEERIHDLLEEEKEKQ